VHSPISRLQRIQRKLVWALTVALCAAGASAAEPDGAAKPAAKPVQLSLHEELQLFRPETSIAGFRLGVTTRNADVTGYDQGLLAARTTGDEVGLQLAPYAEIRGDLHGLQVAMGGADVDGKATGVQLGNLMNRAGALVGLQVAALYNRALDATGVQVSAVNYAEDLKGVQIGLVNVNRRGIVPFFPGINVGF
jgi:hypothetical protein